jgi:glucosylceramidase
MAEYGIEITSITPQNEPLNRGNSASMFMGWEEQLVFVRDYLGPQLRTSGLNTEIYLFDHNYNYDNMADQTDYPAMIYNDATAADYVAGAAYHNYGGVNSELDDIHNRRPDKDLVFTETSIGTWNDGRNLDLRLIEDMEQVALGTVNRWCSAVIVWNLMLDSERGPNRDGGCRTCYGAVDISKSNYSDITRNSHYYIIGHLSSVVKPGAVRIGTSGYSKSGVVSSAFENTDGSYALVLLNKNAATEKLSVSAGGKYFTYTLPAKSVVSFSWKTN